MKKWIVIIAIEFGILLAGVAGLSRQEGTVWGCTQEELTPVEINGNLRFFTEGISLKAGVYEAVLEYRTMEDGVHLLGVCAEDELVFRGLKANHVTLYGDKNRVSCQFYLSASCKELQVYVQEEEGGKLFVDGIHIVSTNAGSRVWAFMTVLLALLINGAVLIYDRNRKKPFAKEAQIAMAVNLMIIGVASLPLMVDYIILGDNVVANLNAIERVSMELANVGAERNVLLVIPALLRRVGFSMNMSYRLFLWMINAATVRVTYRALRNCVVDVQTSLAGTVIWNLNPYRIACLYDRGDMQRVECMILLPFVICMIGVIVSRLRLGNGDRTGGARSKWQRAKRICVVGMIVVGLLSATYQTNQILIQGHPLWVYSMEDMISTQSRNMTFLAEATYGMK